MSMPQNWYAACHSQHVRKPTDKHSHDCEWRFHSDMPDSGAAECRAEAEKHVKEFPTHIVHLEYEEWLGAVKGVEHGHRTMERNIAPPESPETYQARCLCGNLANPPVPCPLHPRGLK